MVKSRLYSENQEEKTRVCFVLDYVFGISLKLLHPFMPFVTSEIYEKLVTYNDKDLMISKWPEYKETLDYSKEEQIVEKNNVVIALKIVETITEFFTPSISFAPYLCPVTTAKPLVNPTITNVIRKNTGATAPTAAKGSTPRVLPTITKSAILYSC